MLVTAPELTAAARAGPRCLRADLGTTAKPPPYVNVRMLFGAELGEAFITGAVDCGRVSASWIYEWRTQGRLPRDRPRRAWTRTGKPNRRGRRAYAN